MQGFFSTPTGKRVRLLLMRVIRVFPREQREWGQGMIAELDGISDFGPRLEWIVGGMMAMSKEALQSLFTGGWRKQPGSEPPYAAAAGIGFLLLLAPFYFIGAALLNQWGVPFFFRPVALWLSHPGQAAAFNILSPIVLLGTLAASVLVNVMTLMSVSREEEGGGTVRVVKLRVRTWNLMALGLGVVLTGVLVGYAFLENFGAHL
ncbi:MAG: hypothetical protein WCC27_05550 [Acidobacteriaceae bacterium]